MASKVLVKLPTVSFSQGKKTDLVTLPDRNENLTQVRCQTINMDRVTQLEQNMKFLQEQHQLTLIALHQEIETLRQKNRDLQLQLVFSKGSTSVPSSPSSPEENGPGFTKPKGSPVGVNVTPLQVELLEKDLHDTKTSLQEVKTQNEYLSEIIEQQKKKLDAIEGQNVKLPMTDIGIQVGGTLDPVRADLVACLRVAETMVKRLRSQNEDHRKEIATLKAASANNSGGNKGGRSRDTNNSHHSRGSPTAAVQEQSSHKFPPLQTQSYWHKRAPRNGRSRHERQDHHSETDTTVLPQLQNSGAKAENSGFETPFYKTRGYRNYYRDESHRKYRGQASQRDRRDGDSYQHRRDYKDRNSKDHQKEQADAAEDSRDAESPQKQ
ncbi:hypothetical protein KM043_001768 [Ampulex compressa]|nr:hypothetical protein KM043_001768 [Ampulex compressa]